MKNLQLAIFLFIFTTTAFAATPLTKVTAQQYFDAIKELEIVQKQFPELEKSFDSVFFADRSKFLKMVKSLPQYSTIEKAVTSTGLDTIEEFYDIGTRVIGGFMAIQTEQMPQGMSIDAILSVQEKSIEQMRAMQLPHAQIEEMLSQLAQQNQAMQGMMTLAKSASAQDKAFVEKNLNWIMENMPEDDDDDDMNE